MPFSMRMCDKCTKLVEPKVALTTMGYMVETCPECGRRWVEPDAGS